jgi:hypothetical protein
LSKSREHLENCIEEERRERDWKQTRQRNQVKLSRANGGYLGTQKRRRTWRPTKHLGELEASIEPRISEWGNPKYDLPNQ